MVLMTTSSWYQIVMNKLYPCSQSSVHVKTLSAIRTCTTREKGVVTINHLACCQVWGREVWFLLHSVLERFLRTCKAINIFFCRGKISSMRTTQVLIFLPNCGFFLWVCYVPIGEWQSICNDWKLNGHHCAFSKWNNNFNTEKHGRGKKCKLSSYNHLSIFSCLIGRLSRHDCVSESDGTCWKWFPRKCSEWPHTFWGSGTP